MALRNCDGTPYRTSSSNQQFDPENPEHSLFNMWDEEIIKIGGSPIFYYEVFIQSGSVDPVYHEDRGKIFSNNPIPLYCLYEPIPSKNQMSAFGIDSPDEMIFEFNYAAVLAAIGHEPKIGSRLYTPHLREDWVIIQRNRGEFKMWGGLRLQILAQKFQESVTTGEGRVTQKTPDFKIKF
jgi:hypothetical protein